MFTRFRLVLLLSLFGLVGCGPAIVQQPTAVKEVLSLPAEGVTVTRELGETLLGKKEQYVGQTVELTSDWEYQSSTELPGTYRVKAGKMNDAGVHKSGRRLFIPIEVEQLSPAGLWQRIGHEKTGDAWDLAFFQTNEMLCWQLFERACIPGSNWQLATYQYEGSTPIMEQELIYNGRVDNAIKFLYREFYRDRARSSFYQDIQYDLSKEREIGFKGARLRIEAATNTTITYTVISNFPDE